MVKVNSENIWRLTSHRNKRVFYVKCPSNSGARIFLAEWLNKNTALGWKFFAPFSKDIILPEQIPEGEEVLQASFRSAVDPLNYAPGNV